MFVLVGWLEVKLFCTTKAMFSHSIIRSLGSLAVRVVRAAAASSPIITKDERMMRQSI